MTEEASKIMNGVLLLILFVLGGKFITDATTPQTYYRFSVNDRDIGRYESLEQCARDEVIYRQAHLQEEINPYQTSCDWK